MLVLETVTPCRPTRTVDWSHTNGRVPILTGVPCPVCTGETATCYVQRGYCEYDELILSGNSNFIKRRTFFPIKERLLLLGTSQQLALVRARYKRLVFTSTLHPWRMSVHEPQAPPATQLGDKKMVAKVLGTRNVLGPSICCHAPIGMAMQVD